MARNWAFVTFQIAAFSIALILLYLSQRFWFVRAWRLTTRVRHTGWRAFLRSALIAALLCVVIPLVMWALNPFRGRWPSSRSYYAILGLWLSSAFLAFLAVKLIAALEWVWLRISALGKPAASPGVDPPGDAQPVSSLAEVDPPNPARRYFFQTASYLAGAIPFVGAFYGFAAERLRYRLERVEVPIPGLPEALDGLRIAQLSDIHIGGYMPASEVRRAVEMANELSPDLAVVTGDFLTGLSDPLEACVAELARLRASLGIWGCNGNHEIYADVEEYASELFRQSGMRILRRENVELTWRGQPFNLIGVDYQRTRSASGRRLPMLRRVENLVRRDIPNILLSHNPNAFPRAAELGIELTLAGHTHGGQVQVEILDSRWSPARFITDFVAGLYQLPLGVASVSGSASAANNGNGDGANHEPQLRSHETQVTRHEPRNTSFLYVNRGLGTVGAPVRIGVPPEITLLVLRRA